MTIQDRIRWEGRLVAKLRMVEDMLQRALDQLEESQNETGWNYVLGQVSKAHEAVIDAAEAARVLCPQAGLA